MVDIISSNEWEVQTVATNDTNSSSVPFCQPSMGGGMIMYMDGKKKKKKGGRNSLFK